MTKPFSIDEFLARIRAALRRSHVEGAQAGGESTVYTNGNLKIDYAAGCVYVSGQEIHLTPIEYKLLCLLAKNTGKVLTHNFILGEVWGNALPLDTPSLRVFMATLRKKIEKGGTSPQYIQTHIGVGYRLIRHWRLPAAALWPSAQSASGGRPLLRQAVPCAGKMDLAGGKGMPAYRGIFSGLPPLPCVRFLRKTMGSTAYFWRKHAVLPRCFGQTFSALKSCWKRPMSDYKTGYFSSLLCRRSMRYPMPTWV